ncbi:MAG: insulinase family protein [Proteobacteria bacterium]|nr:insulinase family protein [Pseudomonadota bacterium]
MTALLLLGAANATELTIPHELYELDNGLTVILAEDHDVPIVQVNVWYHVASKDEVAGRTGFAHLFEHLMFQGSVNNDQDYFAPLQEVGARVNGTTNVDRTNYFEGVPAEYLPLALWGEADRMGWLVVDEDRLANQQDVVRNERRQRYENPPYGTAWVTLLANVFPEGHPYHHPTIGNHEDLEAATLEDVKAFYDTYYVPNNAVLVVAGDFDPDATKGLIDQYFGEIPRAADPTHATAEPVVMTEEVVVRQIEEGVPHQKVWIAWPSPALHAPGDAELDLASSVLSSGKESKLYSALVLDQQIAKEVEAYQVSFGLGSMYIIEATAAAGHDTDELVTSIDAVVDTFIAEGPTDEQIATGVTNYEVNFLRSMATVSGKANKLNSYYYFQGDPDWGAEDLARYTGCTAASVKAAVTETLGSDGRLVLHIVPPAEEAN